MKQLDSLYTGEKFKKTEIGDIPVDWDIKTLINAVGLNNNLIVAGPFGSNLKVEDYRDTGIPIIRLQNIEYCKFINKNIKYISIKKADELNYHSFKKGDIVLAKLDDPIGKTCIIPESMEKGIVVADVVRIRIDEQFSDKKYIMYILNSFYGKRQLNREILGTTRPRVNLNQVRNIVIPYPPLAEQKKIASILSEMDAAIEKKTQIIEKAKELKKGLMQELLTNGIGHKEYKKSKIGEFPGKWDLIKLKNLYKSPIRDFGSFSTTKLVKYKNSGVVYLRSENFKEGKLVPENIMYIDREVHSQLTKSLIYKGLLLFTKIGNIGHADIYDGRYGECNSNATIAKIDIDKNKACIEYIRWLINSRIINKQFSSRIISNQPRINLGDINKLIIPLPPLHEQKKIASILSSVDNEIENEIANKEKLIQIKKGLMQVLLTGKIRVRV